VAAECLRSPEGHIAQASRGQHGRTSFASEKKAATGGKVLIRPSSTSHHELGAAGGGRRDCRRS